MVVEEILMGGWGYLGEGPQKNPGQVVKALRQQIAAVVVLEEECLTLEDFLEWEDKHLHKDLQVEEDSLVHLQG